MATLGIKWTATDSGSNVVDYQINYGCTIDVPVGILGSHNIPNTDPKLTNPANGDFTLQSSSPCIDAGIGHGIDSDIPTTDFVGASRPALFTDIGAYEYTGVTTTTTVGPTTTTTTTLPPPSNAVQIVIYNPYQTADPYDVEPKYNDYVPTTDIDMNVGFVHIPWPTHKFLLLQLEDGTYYKVYIDSPLDTIYDSGDTLNKYDQICRNVSVANKDLFPDWEKFDGFKKFNGLDLEGCILELINFNPFIDFGDYFPNEYNSLA